MINRFIDIFYDNLKANCRSHEIPPQIFEHTDLKITTIKKYYYVTYDIILCPIIQKLKKRKRTVNANVMKFLSLKLFGTPFQSANEEVSKAPDNELPYCIDWRSHITEGQKVKSWRADFAE